jgi:hypothetical protein
MAKPSDYIRIGWCQGTLAKDAHGNACLETSPDAVQWCIYGAVYMAYANNPRQREKVLDRLPLPISLALGKWNDDPQRTQAEVVGLLQSIGE